MGHWGNVPLVFQLFDFSGRGTLEPHDSGIRLDVFAYPVKETSIVYFACSKRAVSQQAYRPITVTVAAYYMNFVFFCVDFKLSSFSFVAPSHQILATPLHVFQRQITATCSSMPFLADRNGRAYGTSCRLSSVPLSVVVCNGCIVAERQIVWENFYTNNQPCALNIGMQNFSDLVKGNILKFGVERWGGVEKNVRFQRKTGHNLENKKRYGQGCY